ncbi:MAG TPA: hypothetical protein PKD87_02745 [Burkholderiaceae bacterium]|nr:hypothetical protein [Burkholderiaceae bacterium]
MNVSRNFLLIGALYLLLGMLVGLFMSATQEFEIATVHAHINLLGFAAMTLFGLTYRLVADLAKNWMAKAHFWLHQIGALVFFVFLYLLLSENLAESVAGPMVGIGGLLMLLGTLIWTGNLWRNAA